MLGWELPPHNSGGLGVACYQLCQALARRGADIDFILPYTPTVKYPFMNVLAAHDQHVLEVIKTGEAYDSYRYRFSDGSEREIGVFDQQALYERCAAGIAKHEQYDVVHAHDWLTFRAALRIKQRHDWPLIVHVHSIERDRAGGFQGNPMVREIESLTMNLADRIIAVSNHTKRMIVSDYHIPADKIEVVHNSIELADIEPLDEDNAYRYIERMKNQGWRVVVNIGRQTIQKGLPNLLYAAQKVIARAPKTLFLFVGSGEQYHELITLAAQLGIADKVLFTGFQRGKRWRDAYAVADLFVMPSVSEPFGLTPLEAIGYGTPALISRQSGVSEVIINCLKVDFWDVNEMANMMTAVVQNDGLRDELHANSLREYNRLSWNRAADRLMDLYQVHSQGSPA